jgi:hypothetical protein
VAYFIEAGSFYSNDKKHDLTYFSPFLPQTSRREKQNFKTVPLYSKYVKKRLDPMPV